MGALIGLVTVGLVAPRVWRSPTAWLAYTSELGRLTDVRGAGLEGQAFEIEMVTSPPRPCSRETTPSRSTSTRASSTE